MSEVRKGKIKDKVVDIGINTRSVYVQDVERKVKLMQNKTCIHTTFSGRRSATRSCDSSVHVFLQVILIQHPLHLISYCAEDRRYDNIFAYIIKPKKKDQPIVCYVYETLDTEVYIHSTV